MTKRVTVQDLRYRFPAIEAHLRRGEEIEVYKRHELIGRLIPAQRKPEAYPDFAAIRLRIFGKKKSLKTGTEIVSEQREPY
ncbi:MAG: hypothetical protein ACRD51_10345 [Candidatus Acidiferrum sp.]